MTWQLAIICHQVIESVVALVYRYYAKRHPEDKYITNAVMYSLVIVPFGIILSLSRGGPSFDLSVKTIVAIIGLGLLFALGNAANYKAASKLQASSLSVITSIRPVFIIIIATLFLSESLSLLNSAGATIIVIAGLYAAKTLKSSNKKVKNTYILIAVISALIMSIAITGERRVISSISLETYMVFGWISQAFFMVILAWSQRNRLNTILSDGSLKIILSLGILRAISGLCFITAMQLSGNASQVGALTGLHIVLTTFGAFIFLNEKSMAVQKTAAAILSVLGIVLVMAS